MSYRKSEQINTRRMGKRRGKSSLDSSRYRRLHSKYRADYEQPQHSSLLRLWTATAAATAAAAAQVVAGRSRESPDVGLGEREREKYRVRVRGK